MVKNPPACQSYEGSPKALLLDLLFFLLYFNDLSEYVESTVYLFAKDPVSYLAISLKDSCLELHTDWMSWRIGSKTASCRRKELEAFINVVANFHSAPQFTFIVSEIELPFLDITLRISGTRVQISVHYNDTDTLNFLHFSSLHPEYCRRSIPYSQFLRLRRICSSDGDFLLRSKEMVSFFTYRGYRLSSSENDPSEQSDKRW